MFVSSLSRFAGGWIISVEPTQAIALRLLAVASVCAILGQLLFAVDSSTALFCAVLVIGCSDGLFWCALPVASIRVFGAKHSGGIFGMIISFGTVGIVTFSYAVQPAVYDAHTATGDTECDAGIACFSTYHLLCAAGSIGLLVTGSYFATHVLTCQMFLIGFDFFEPCAGSKQFLDVVCFILLKIGLWRSAAALFMPRIMHVISTTQD